MSWYDDNDEATQQMQELQTHAEELCRKHSDLEEVLSAIIHNADAAKFPAAKELFKELIEALKEEEEVTIIESLPPIRKGLSNLEKIFFDSGSLDLRAQKKAQEKKLRGKEKQLLLALKGHSEHRFFFKKTRALYEKAYQLAQERQFKTAAQTLMEAPLRAPRDEAIDTLRQLQKVKKELASLEELEPIPEIKNLVQGTMIDATIAEIDAMKIDMGDSSSRK